MKKILSILCSFASLGIIQGYSHLPPNVSRACRTIFNPQFLTTSCCKQTDQFVRYINECRGSDTTITTCDQVKCVAGKFDLIENGKIIFNKAVLLLKVLSKQDEVSASINGLIRKYCVQQDYRAFPSKITNCMPWKYMNCAFYAYRLACGNLDPSATCRKIRQYVDECKPYQEQFVKKLNSQYRRLCSDEM